MNAPSENDMAIPKKLLASAFAKLSKKTLQQCAEHNGLRGWKTLTKDELCKRLSSDDGGRLQSYTSYFKVAELKSIAVVFGIKTKGKKKDELDYAIWSFVQDYDKLARGLTYDDVFGNTRDAQFAGKLNDWMDSRHSQMKLGELSPGEQTLWQIRFNLMEINGNSFPGVFEGGENDRPNKFSDALNEVGAKRSARAFEKIGKLMFDGSVPSTTRARADALVFESDDESDAFDEIIDQCHDLWDAANEDIPQLCVRFAARNPDRFR